MAHDFEKKWRSEDVRLKENVDFSALLLSERVLKGLEEAGFKKPSPIQLEAIPIAKIGKDVIVQAKSGTGKTLIFVIAALEAFRRKLFRPQVLILAPTREIAAQICSVIKSVSSSAFPKLTCCSFIGGLSISDDRDRALTCQIVVGTPGRLRHLISEKALPVNSVRLLVFDEADQLLQLSFKEEIEDIFKALPLDKQVIATSATYPDSHKTILLRYMRQPYLSCLKSNDLNLLGMVHYARVVQDSPIPILLYRTKLSVLEEILKAVRFSQCLVFCNGIKKVEDLYRDIKTWGFSTAYISSAKEQEDRLKAVERLKRFKCKVLVSSDVTARGIDAENVDFVINFDLPFNTETYMHRVGRAGRYGSIGVAITIIDEKELLYLSRMENSASFKTFKLPDKIPKDLIQKARFEEGEFVIKTDDIESLKMLRKQQRIKTKNSINEKDKESADEKANKDLENASNSNCTIAEPMHAKQIVLGENNVTDSAENENVEMNIAHVVDCNGSNYDLSKLIATKPTLSEGKTAIERSENETSNNDIEQLDDSSNINNCILKKTLETEQNSTVENNTVKSRMENLQSEHLPEYSLSVGDYVSCQEKKTEENSDNFFVRDTCGNINSSIISFTEGALQESNKNLDSAEVVGKGRATKPGVENIDAECGHSNSETLVNEIKAKVENELLNELKISDAIEIEEENHLPVNLYESGSETFVNKDEIYINSNNVQKVELCDITHKKEISAIAKMFINQYEFSSQKEPYQAGKSYESFQKVLSSAITLSTITDLNHHKSEYFYKVFKKFQEGELQTVENKSEPNDASTSLQNMTFQQVASLKENGLEEQVQNSAATDLPVPVSVQKVLNSDSCSQSYVTNSVPNSSSEQNVTTGENGENIQIYLRSPKCKSTSQLRIESEEGQNQLQTSGDSDRKLPKLNNLITAFEELTDESDSDDLDESENSTDLEISEELSSDSCSDSCSSNESSSDGCSTLSSSEDITRESHCHCKTHSTRQHYSSSVSSSSGTSRDCENIYRSRYDTKHCNANRDRRYCQQNYNCSSSKRNESQIRCTACKQNQYSACLRRRKAACCRSCFLPSVQHETAACSQWHQTFYNQWQHIQSCINMHLHFSK